MAFLKLPDLWISKPKYVYSSTLSRVSPLKLNNGLKDLLNTIILVLTVFTTNCHFSQYTSRAFSDNCKPYSDVLSSSMSSAYSKHGMFTSLSVTGLLFNDCMFHAFDTEHHYFVL